MIRSDRGIENGNQAPVLLANHSMCALRGGCLAGGSAVGIFFEASLNLFDFRTLGDEGLHAVLIDL